MKDIFYEHRFSTYPEFSKSEIQEKIKNAVPLPFPGVADTCDYVNQGDGLWRVTPLTFLKHYPYCCAGLLIAWDHGEAAYKASGSVIGSNVVLTSAHNVYHPIKKKIFDMVAFVPSMPLNGEPFAAIKVFIPSNYMSIPGTIRDYALIYTDEAQPFDVEASLGIVCNRKPDNDQWFTLAYPGRHPFNGTDQITDDGKFNIKAFIQGGLTFRDNVISMDRSDLGCGASGSPWLISLSNEPPSSGIPFNQRVPGGTIIHPAGIPITDVRRHYINGITSSLNKDKPGFIYSPELGKSFIAFFQEVTKSNPISTISRQA